MASKAALLETLEVRRNAKLGFAVGVVFAVAIYGFFVVIPGATHSPFLYVTLGFVLAFSIGALATAILTARTAMRVAREQDAEEAEGADTSASADVSE